MIDYSSEEFWKGAPEGATHIIPEGFEDRCVTCWAKKLGGEWFYNYEGLRTSRANIQGWRLWDAGEKVVDLMIQRPAPQWSGDGLPSVGTVCEYRIKDGIWFPCTVKLILNPCPGSKWQIIADCPHLEWDQLLDSKNCALRPIRTQAQIEAEERDAAIDEMSGWAGVTGLDMARERRILGRLYDGGYRLVKP